MVFILLRLIGQKNVINIQNHQYYYIPVYIETPKYSKERGAIENLNGFIRPYFFIKKFNLHNKITNATNN